MRPALRSTLALGLGLGLAVAVASCGGGEAKLLPGDTAREINENLAAVRTLAAEGECVDAQDAAQQVGSQVDNLGNIDPKLKLALEEGAERLNEVVLGCTEATTEEEFEETLPTTVETTTGPTKPKKEKPEKEEPGKEFHEEAEPAPEPTEPTPKSEQEPPKGEAKGHQPPPAEPPQQPSGGIGPGRETGGGG